ncbi:MAG: HD domain-containing protein, partial [Oscillospiraceae bacterium]|nr:HD domain-containing protein [Oscillospiraceae bacterium]
MKIRSPQYDSALAVLRALERHGHTCWFVGGCVRDAVLAGIRPGADIVTTDTDLAASASPEQMMGVFAEYGWTVLPTGIQHGTLTVRPHAAPLHSIEVTTFRVDGGYSDGRHPDAVTFTGSIDDDLSRRDFTINAMAWHPERGLLDPYGGRDGLEQQLIRTVGEPDRRFSEDALRMLRAIRFAAKLGFSIEDGTWEAIRAHARDISKVAHERCASELTQIIRSPRPEALRTLRDAGLLSCLLPEIDILFDPETGAQRNPHHVHTVGEHTVRVMQNVPPDPALRLTAMLHDAGKPLCRRPHISDGRDTFYGHPQASERIAKDVLKRLCVSKPLRERILPLIRYHDTVPEPDDAYAL